MWAAAMGTRSIVCSEERDWIVKPTAVGIVTAHMQTQHRTSVSSDCSDWMWLRADQVGMTVDAAARSKRIEIVFHNTTTDLSTRGAHSPRGRCEEQVALSLGDVIRTSVFVTNSFGQCQ